MKAACGAERIFIVDEAHGAHYNFSDKCPVAAMQGGGDAAITSVHKTLGGIAGTAVLNVAKGSRLDAEKVRQQYLIMAGSSED